MATEKNLPRIFDYRYRKAEYCNLAGVIHCAAPLNNGISETHYSIKRSLFDDDVTMTHFWKKGFTTTHFTRYSSIKKWNSEYGNIAPLSPTPKDYVLLLRHAKQDIIKDRSNINTNNDLLSIFNTTPNVLDCLHHHDIATLMLTSK